MAKEYKKIYALIPSEREKPCIHSWRWNGKMPCTGRQECYMCGAFKDEVDKEKICKV